MTPLDEIIKTTPQSHTLGGVKGFQAENDVSTYL